MSFNIVDLITDQIKGQVTDQMGSLLGNESGKAAEATASVIPALLSGLMGSSATGNGAGALFKAVQDQDDGLIDNIGSLLGGGQASSIIDNGNSLLGGLLGTGGLGKLAGALTAFTGLSKGGTSSMMGMLAPIIIGAIKRKVTSGGMDASGLANMLMDQKSNISAAMPAGLGDQLNASGFLSELSGSASSTVANAASSIKDDSDSGSSVFRWLLPLVAVAAIAFLGSKFIGGTDVDDLAGGVDISNIGENFSGVLGSATESLSSITDVDSATAAVPALTDAGSKLTELTGILDKLPEAARAPITELVNNGLGSLQPIIDTVLAIPGVGSIIEPIVGPMLEALTGLIQ